MVTHGKLDALFRPRSVAVFGAGEQAGSIGTALLRNLLISPFGGVVHPIDPERRALHGVATHARVTDLAASPDLAVIAHPAARVADCLKDCVEAQVPAAVVLSAGFSDPALQEQIRAVVRGRLRLLGPNSFGVMVPPAQFNASTALMPRPGRVALLTRSGAIGASILDWAAAKGIGFSAVVGLGTRLDVDFADLLDHLADDPNTRSVVLYLESIGNVRHFLSAARNVARTMPVIVVKAGRTTASSRIETSDDRLYDAAFRRAGVLRVNTIRDLFSMSEILATQPQPRGPALGIVGNAGAPGIMAADALLLEGGRLAQLPEGWTNPLDLRPEATPEQYRRAVEACLGMSGVHGVLVLLSPQIATRTNDVARALIPFAQSGKPLLTCWMGGAGVQEARAILSSGGLPTFDSPEAAVRAFLHMVQYRRTQELLHEKPEAQPVDWQPMPLSDRPGAEELLHAYGLGPRPEVGAGQALVLGCHPEDRFGPVIYLGTAGLPAERAFALPPLNGPLARRLIERTSLRALTGPALATLEGLLVRFSQLVVDWPSVRTIDIPLILRGEELFPGAGSVVFWGEDTPAECRPRLVIHPYPNQYTAPYRLRDGRQITVRAIRPEDEERIVAMHASHSEHTIRMRYFSLVKTLTRDSLIRLCHLDYDREMALAAVLEEPSGQRFCGVSRYYLDPETNEAEFALIVSDGFQRQGLGRHLMDRLIAIARERRIGRLVGDVLQENVPMLGLMRAMGFRETRATHDVVRVELDLG